MALSLVLLWYAATSEVPWLFLLAVWVFTLTAAAAFYAEWNRRGLRLRLAARSIRPAPGSPLEELPEQVLRLAPGPATIFEGDELQVEVGLDTTGASRGPASVAGTIAGSPVTFATGVVPRAGWRETAVVSNLRRGPLGAASWEIGSGDFLGFFRNRAASPDVEVGLVLPRFTSLAARRRTLEVETSTAAPRAGAGGEVFGVREYRPGDSLRRIHWRSSARHGELIVREYEPPGAQALTICLDPKPRSREVADQIARIAASEAWDCVREGGRVTLWSPGAEPAEAQRDLWMLLEWLARYPERSPAGADSYPTRSAAGDVIAITAGDRQVVENARRAWIVGEAEVDVDFPVERVGTAWPL